MFRTRSLVLIFISLLFAAGAALVANNWMQQQQALVQDSVPDTRTVVVAAHDIPYGQTIEQRHIKLEAWPEQAVPKQSFNTLEDVVGKVTTQPILPGEILRSERISDHLEGATLAALIDPDKRAFTIRVNDVVGVAGFLLPGNKIDVITTRQVGSRVQSETILRDIKVLAVDQKARTDSNDPIVVRAVTLELTPKESEKLAKARDEGNIQLTLRNPVAEDQPVAKVTRKPRPSVYREPDPQVIVIKGTDYRTQKVPL